MSKSSIESVVFSVSGAQGDVVAGLFPSECHDSHLNFVVHNADFNTSLHNSQDAERGAKCSPGAEMVTSTDFKIFLSSNVFDLRPDNWKTDFCLQKSNSFCSPSFGEERGVEAWRDLL
jgi:hypothetical protein